MLLEVFLLILFKATNHFNYANGAVHLLLQHQYLYQRGEQLRSKGHNSLSRKVRLAAICPVIYI